ncbi:MAG: hypothetical protein WCL16_13640 [bacterium]
MASKIGEKRLDRPVKKLSDRRRREKVQRRRLITLGMTEAAVAKLGTEQVRLLVLRPAKIKAAG